MAANDLFRLDYLADQVGLNLGATDDISLAKAKKYLNRALIRFSEMGIWSWQYAPGQSFSTVNGTETYEFANVLKIKSMWMASPIQRRLSLVNDRQFRGLYPNTSATGTPYLYRKAGYSSTTVDAPKFAFYPIPNGVFTVYYDCIRPITLMSADTNDVRLITGMPSNLIDILIEMATAIGYKEIDDSMSAKQMEECMLRLSAAFREDQSEIDDVMVMRAFESEDAYRYDDPVLPPQYGPY